MPSRLMTWIDRPLAQRARTNAAAAVRADARNAAMRREAVTTLLSQSEPMQLGRTSAR